MKIFSFLQLGPPLANKAPSCKTFKGCLFLLAARPAWQAVYRLDFRPYSFPWPMLLFLEQPTHPYIATLFSPSHGKSLGPGICSLNHWALLPPWRKSRANVSWIKLNHPRRGEMEDNALHWKGGPSKSGYDFPTLDREDGRSGGSSSAATRPTHDCSGRWRSNGDGNHKAQRTGSFPTVRAQPLM